MVTTISTPTGQYAYLLLAFKGNDQERELWEALFERDKAELSVEVYSRIIREMPALKESARIKQAKSVEKAHARRLFLLALPEYAHVIRFIQSNIRRPAFREHLKRLILHGDSNPERSPATPAPNPASEASPASEAAHHAETRESVTPTTAKRSPRGLFSKPRELLQVMVLDLKKPEAERRFIWDEIPPEDYPEAMREMKPFDRLVQFWNETKRPYDEV
jgi:hypothetical protein